jgi:hypothetical protein
MFNRPSFCYTNLIINDDWRGAMFSRLILIVGLFGALTLVGCSDAPKETAATHVAEENILELKAVGLTFEGKSEIPSGWVTIRFENLSPMVHLALVEKLPEGVGAKQFSNEVIALFQSSLDYTAAGDSEAANNVFAELPDYFGELVFYGGPGLISAGGYSEVTLYLEPGTYLIECYVKSNGVLHNYSPDPETLGMVHELTVLAEKGQGVEPAHDVEMEISSSGYEVLAGLFKPGRNTVKVTFTDQVVYSSLVGHDAHVARLDDGVDKEALINWVNFVNADGQATPSPYHFVGGVHDMPAGSVTYFTMDLEPGRYAIIGEVPDALASGHYMEFEVAEP